MILRRIPWKVELSSIEGNFEECWRRMCKDLRKPKTFITTGGTREFKVWSEGYRLFYEKATEDICPLSKSDVEKAYKVFRKTGSLSSTTYHFTMHGSYIPPLLYRYFLRRIE
jgi:hypothetical protein